MDDSHPLELAARSAVQLRGLRRAKLKAKLRCAAWVEHRATQGAGVRVIFSQTSLINIIEGLNLKGLRYQSTDWLWIMDIPPRRQDGCLPYAYAPMRRAILLEIDRLHT
jgi:hypothetical protein